MGTFHFGTGERWALVAAFAYTIVNVTLRSAAPTIDPVLGSLLRLVPLFLLAWAIVLRGGGVEFRPGHASFLGWRLIGALLIGGSVSFVVGNILYFRALVEGGLGITVAGLQAGSVLGGLWIGLLVLHERPGRAQVAGAGFIVAGLAGIAIANTATLLELWWLGLLLAFGAGTTYAIANSMTSVVQRQRPILFVTLAGSTLGGVVPLVAIVVVRGVGGPAAPPPDGGAVAAVLAAGVANSLALASLALAVRHTTVAATNTITSASIVLSFVASVVLFAETGSPPMIVGVLLVTAGIVVAQLRRAAPPLSDREAVM